LALAPFHDYGTFPYVYDGNIPIMESGGAWVSRQVSQAAGQASGQAPGQAPGQVRRRVSGQRHTPWRAAFFALAITGIVAGVAWALVGSRFLVVRSIQVTGTHLVPRAEVLAAARIPDGLPLIRVNTVAVADRIERITQIESAQVSRAWPTGVRISVRERTPVLAVASGRGYQLIDKFGVAVEQAARPPVRMPRFMLPPGSPSAGSPAAGSPAGGSQSAGPQALASLRGSPAVYAAAAVLRELPATLASKVTEVAAPSASDVTLTLSAGITIVWGGTDRPAAKAKELAVLMRVRARSYDVSAPGTAMTGG
jgi:cell division protein FtsQ